jgi:hypothetical protein
MYRTYLDSGVNAFVVAVEPVLNVVGSSAAFNKFR